MKKLFILTSLFYCFFAIAKDCTVSEIEISRLNPEIDDTDELQVLVEDGLRAKGYTIDRDSIDGSYRLKINLRTPMFLRQGEQTKSNSSFLKEFGDVFMDFVSPRVMVPSLELLIGNTVSERTLYEERSENRAGSKILNRLLRDLPNCDSVSI